MSSADMNLVRSPADLGLATKGDASRAAD